MYNRNPDGVLLSKESQMHVQRNASDEDVVRLVRNGDASAFRFLVDRYKLKSMSLAVRLLKDEQAAEDALQDSFIKAYTALGGFRNDATFATWFYRIVYTTCLNVLKKQSRAYVHIELDEETLVGGDVHFDITSIDDALVDETIREELTKMSPLYASLMDLLYVQECSYEDIVKITGLPLGTVKTRLNRGRHALRQALLKRIPDLASWMRTS